MGVTESESMLACAVCAPLSLTLELLATTHPALPSMNTTAATEPRGLMARKLLESNLIDQSFN